MNSAVRTRAARVAVLGGSGFAGRSIVEALSTAGITVRAFSRRTGCDLLDESAAYAVLARFSPTHIINCAAVVGSVNYADEHAADVIDVNSRLVLGAYRVAQRLPAPVMVNLVANCVYPGEMELYQESRLWDGPPHESVQSYGESRRLLLTLAECYRRQKGLFSINLLVPNMYGPHDSTDPNKTHALNALVLKFVRAVQNHEAQVEVWGTGRPVREWLFVRDLARVVLQVVEEDARWPEPLNVAQRRGWTVRDLVDLLRKASGYTGSVVYETAYGDGAPTKVMDDHRFREYFPAFSFTPIEAGIEQTLAYYAETLKKDHEHLLL